MGKEQEAKQPPEQYVFVPTIKTVILPNGQDILNIQWNTKGSRDQCVFPLLNDHNEESLGTYPFKPTVLFLGKIKDWVIPSAVQAIADYINNGNTDAWVACVSVPLRVDGASPDYKHIFLKVMPLKPEGAEIMEPVPYYGIRKVHYFKDKKGNWQAGFVYANLTTISPKDITNMFFYPLDPPKYN